MLIDIDDLDGITWTVYLGNVGVVYEDDDVIYFNGAPFRLSSARPAIRLTPLQADAAMPGEAEQLESDAAQLKHGR